MVHSRAGVSNPNAKRDWVWMAELSCMGKMRANGIVRWSKRGSSPSAPGKHYLIGKYIQYYNVPNFFQDKLEIKNLIYNLMIFNYNPILLNIFIGTNFCLRATSLLIFGKVIIAIKMKEGKEDNVMRIKAQNGGTPGWFSGLTI